MQLTSHIDRVKLYAAGATVSRVATLRQTEEQVEIPGLPLALDDGSVRVRVESDSDNCAIATDVRIGLAVPSPTQTPPRPEAAEIQAAETQVKQLEQLLSLVKTEVKVLAQIKVPNRPQGDADIAPPPSQTAMRMAIAEYKSEQIRARIQEKRDIDERLRRAREHLEDLVEKEKRASSAREARPNELRKMAIVRLSYPENESDRAPSEQRLILEYFVPGARWTPTYIFRLDTVNNTAAITLRALICQRSGEDWSGVSLELSTARPQMWCELPELPTLRLGRAQPLLKSSGWRSPPKGAQLLFEDYDRYRTIEVREESKSVRVPQIFPEELRPMAQLFDRSEDDFEEELDLSEEAEDLLSDEGDDEFHDLTALLQERNTRSSGTKESFYQDDLAGRTADMGGLSEFSSPLSDIQSGAKQATKFSRQALSDRPPVRTPFSLEYNLMEMGKPGDRERRGKLFIKQRREIYLEFLDRQNAAVNFDFMSVVETAISKAQSCLNLPLPGGGMNVREVAGSFDYAYHSDGRVDIPSDGEFHSVALTHQNTDLDIYYVAVPRFDENVFRMGKLYNPFQSPLLKGSMDVYLDGEYLLSSTLQTAPPKAKMNLGFGVEQSIKIARNTSFTENRGSDLIIGGKALRHEIKIDVSNNLSKVADIEIRERLPVPQKDAKVDVAIDAVSPDWEKYNQTELGFPIKGGYRWRVNLAPGERQCFSAQYTVTISEDSDLIGGNRREE